MNDIDRLKPTFLVLSQVFVPDPASVGQHMADALAEIVRRGYRVVVLTANRGYENPAIRYPSREVIKGVEICRLPFSSFGKRFIFQRLFAGMFFVVQCIFRGLFIRRITGILVSTSPPVCIIAALVVHFVRRAPIKFWVMDLNPDQLIALGKIQDTSLAAKLFDFLNRLILKQASDVIVLDKYMAERVNRKCDVSRKLHIIPPWPHEDHLKIIDHKSNPFRKKHGLEDNLVLMYSGNLSICSPVTTILQAALLLQDEKKLIFLFIGGGLGKKEVEQTIEQHHPNNIRLLPYQPLSEIKFSLSAADVHIVSLGNNMSGIIHPCKVYGAMAVARPILFLGPKPSFITDILDKYNVGWHIPHGNVELAVQTIRKIMCMDQRQLVMTGVKTRSIISNYFSKQKLCGELCDVLDNGLK